MGSLRPIAAVGLVLYAGCLRKTSYECNGDQSCTQHGHRLLQLPRPSCASGNRYGNSAGDGLAGQCTGGGGGGGAGIIRVFPAQRLGGMVSPPS